MGIDRQGELSARRGPSKWVARVLLSGLAFSASGCLASTQASPGIQSWNRWNVDERVGLRGAAPAKTTRPTQITIVPRGTMLVDANARRTLCGGDAPCTLYLRPGSYRVSLYDESPANEPAAEFWLDVDGRPMQLEPKHPKVGLSYVGAGLAVAGLLSVVLSPAARAADNESAADGLLIGGIAMGVIGFGLGGVYWAVGRGDVSVTSLETASP